MKTQKVATVLSIIVIAASLAPAAEKLRLNRALRRNRSMSDIGRSVRVLPRCNLQVIAEARSLDCRLTFTGPNTGTTLGHTVEH